MAEDAMLFAMGRDIDFEFLLDLELQTRTKICYILGQDMGVIFYSILFYSIVHVG